MNELQAGEGRLEMAIQITRKETGKVEEYTLISEPGDHEVIEKPEKQED